jgi:hypothetical protein
MVPAEIPRKKLRKLFLKSFRKKMTRLPSTVERPAKKEKRRGPLT